MRQRGLFPPVDPATRQKKKSKGPESRSTLTVNGRVALLRRRYHSEAEGGSTPSDALLDAMNDTISQATRELCVQLNRASRGFEMTSENLKSAAQLSLSHETMRQMLEAEGKAALALARSGELQPTWHAADAKLPDGKSLVYMSCDGFTAPTITDAEKHARREKVVEKRKAREDPKRPLPPLKPGSDGRYKEFKAVIFFDHDLNHRQVAVTHGDCNAAGVLMIRDAGRLEFKAADQRVGLIDGGPWIINQIHQRGLKTTAIGLDFFHLGENVHKTRNVVFGEANKEKSDPGSKWAADLLHTAKHEGYEAMRRKVMDLRADHRCGKRKEIDRLLEYITDRREMIHYEQFIANDWHIGSGAMESQCRVIPDRVKGPGKRWDADNAEAIMALEALHQSDQSAAYRQLAMCGPN